MRRRQNSPGNQEVWISKSTTYKVEYFIKGHFAFKGNQLESRHFREVSLELKQVLELTVDKQGSLLEALKS